jgi:hypothetical protein
MEASERALALLAKRSCWNCKFCLDEMITGWELDVFSCVRKYDDKILDLPEELICESWEDVKDSKDFALKDWERRVGYQHT